MPVTIRQVTYKGKKRYEVRTPNGVHSKHTTRQKAEAQRRLLNAIEHGLKPTKKRKGKTKNGRRKKKT